MHLTILYLVKLRLFELNLAQFTKYRNVSVQSVMSSDVKKRFFLHLFFYSFLKNQNKFVFNDNNVSYQIILN